MKRSLAAALDRVFGEEGSVAADPKVQVVMAATGIAITGLYLVSPIVSVLTGPFAVSEAAAGQLVTAFTAPSIVFIPVFGVLADRHGKRPILVGGLLAIGLGGAAVALAPTFEVAMAFRVVQGVGYAAVNPIGVAIIGDAYAGSRETTAQGLRVVSIQTAGLIAPAVAGVLVVAAWQYPFLLYLLALPVAAWAHRTLPRSAAAGTSSIRSYLADLRSSLSTMALGAVVLSFIPRFTLSFALVAYVSVVLARLGASSVIIGGVVALIGLVSLLASTQAGRVTTRFDPLHALLGGFLALGGGMVALGIAASYALVGVGVLAVGVGIGLSGPIQKSLVTQLAPPDVRTGTVSSALVFQSIGAAGGPLLMGLALQYAEVGATFVAFGLAFGTIGAILTLVAGRADRRRIGST